MDVLILTAFVSLVLVFIGLWFFAWTYKQRTHEHADRLVLLPLDEEPGATLPSYPTSEEQS